MEHRHSQIYKRRTAVDHHDRVHVLLYKALPAQLREIHVSCQDLRDQDRYDRDKVRLEAVDQGADELRDLPGGIQNALIELLSDFHVALYIFRAVEIVGGPHRIREGGVCRQKFRLIFAAETHRASRHIRPLRGVLTREDPADKLCQGFIFGNVLQRKMKFPPTPCD